MASDAADNSALLRKLLSALAIVMLILAPMLVFQASDDAVAPAADAGLALLAEFPDRVTLVEVPRAAHALLPEQPAKIAAACLKFLRQFP